MDLDRALTVAQWWRSWQETNNRAFAPLIFDRHRFLVLMGGGGSGKSIFAGRKILERAATEPRHRFLVCRKVKLTLRESCYSQLVAQTRDYYAAEVARISDLHIRFKNGSEILFAGLDDVEKLKSIHNITGIWIEEASELEEADLNQLNIRLRGKTEHYKQIILSFNPISVTHWLKRRFFDNPPDNCRTMHSTYKDNRFLDEENVQELLRYRETDPYYYAVYALGQWGVTGKTVFDAAAVTEHLAKLPPAASVGRFEIDYDQDKQEIRGFHWREDPDGFIKLYKKPEAGRPYVIGGDTAGEGSDRFVGMVCDNVTGEIVAKLRHTFDEDLYARQMYCLGKYYEGALIAIECNYSTFPQKELERLGYRNFYVREREDTYTGAMVQAFGFKTTAVTRPIILAGLIQMAREHLECFRDVELCDEMLTFVRNEKGRMEAAEGAHDDCVMAAAIMYYARPQMRMQVQAQTAPAKWTRDMWDDYQNATAEEREMMQKLFGTPEGGQRA